MRLETIKRLEDARAACARIKKFIHGMTKMEFVDSALVRAAVERQVEIIGESLGRAAADEPEVEQLVPQLRKIVGMRNRLIHGYDQVDYNVLWDVATGKTPELEEQLKRLISPSN